MNDQQRAAMQMALEALFTYEEDWPEDNEGGVYLRVGYDDKKVLKAITALREALAQPQDQGENNGQRNDHGNTKYSDDNSGNLCSNSDSEAPVKPQGEPVAWGYFDADGSLMDAVGWQHGAYQTPLYTTSPSVEANDYVLCEVQQEWYVKGWKDAAEKAAKVVDDLSGGDMWIQGIAENIRGMGK